MAYGKKQRRKIIGGKYYWELQDWANRLFIENDKCLICGVKDNLEPHHVVKVKPYDKMYTDVDNGVVLCKSCHRKYHEVYGEDINCASLIKFALAQFKTSGGMSAVKLNNKLKKSDKMLKYYKNETNRLKGELEKLEMGKLECEL